MGVTYKFIQHDKGQTISLSEFCFFLQFLERGFICFKVWGLVFHDLISFFLNIP